MKPSSRLQEFHLTLQQAGLSKGTIRQYLATIARGIDNGDMLEVIRAAKTPGAWAVRASAVVRWARFTGDLELEVNATTVPRPDGSADKELITEAQRGVIVDAITESNALPEAQKAVLLALIWSGVRPGAVLSAKDQDFQTLIEGAAEGRGVASLRALRKFVGSDPVWKLISGKGLSAAYALVRRRIRKIAVDLGVKAPRIEDFRRLLRTL